MNSNGIVRILVDGVCQPNHSHSSSVGYAEKTVAQNNRYYSKHCLGMNDDVMQAPMLNAAVEHEIAVHDLFALVVTLEYQSNDLLLGLLQELKSEQIMNRIRTF